MGREHPTDTLWRAQELYCVDRLSYAAVAEATGVSATTLKAWGQKYGWARRREEIARAESEIRVNIIKGRQKALEQLLAAEDAKEAAPMAFAVSSLESLALKRQELAAAGKIPDVSAFVRRKIATRADAVAALREAVERKLGLALADPDKISTATVQDVTRGVRRCRRKMRRLSGKFWEPAKPEKDAWLGTTCFCRIKRHGWRTRPRSR